MLKIFLSVLTVSFTQLAQATSLHPCTPTVQAQPTIMYCADGVKRYSIVIQTLMSKPLPMCQGANHFERHTAQIKLSINGVVSGTATLNHDSFKHSLAAGTFISPKNSLYLKNCISPIHGGGFSIGN